VIATNNLLFVDTDIGVYAVDLSTHQTVWTLWIPGFQMAISPSGILYVLTSVEYSFQSGGYVPSAPAMMAINLH
jgi:outer membrane protein assembly factor BamB